MKIYSYIESHKVMNKNTTHNEERLDFLISMLGKGNKIK